MIADLFRQYGYHGTTYSLIQKVSGLGKGSLYHHFAKGKDDIARAVLVNVHEWFEENVFKPLEEKDTTGDALDRSFQAVIDFFHRGERVCVPGSFALHDARDAFPDEIELYFERWIQSLSRYLSRKGVPRKESHTLAVDTVMHIQGALVVSRSLRHPPLFEEALLRLRSHLKEKLNAINKEMNEQINK